MLSDAAAFNAPTGHVVLAMITSASNPPLALDCPIEDLAIAGLPAPTAVRQKLFTLDARLIRGTLGRLAPQDATCMRQALAHLIGPLR